MRTTGYICPTLLPPKTASERVLFASVIKYGLALHRVHAGGLAVRLTGPGGTHVVAESVHWLKLHEVIPNYREA